MSLLEWSAAAIALAGAWALGYKAAPVRLLGWSCFLMSNVLFITWGVLIGAVGFTVMQLCFLLTSVRGIVTVWREKP